MSRTKESLTYPEAVDILGDATAAKTLREAAVARVEVTVEEGDATVCRDIALDLLRIVHEES